eukprot:2021495-Prymnesium_polylepis.1
MPHLHGSRDSVYGRDRSTLITINTETRRRGGAPQTTTAQRIGHSGSWVGTATRPMSPSAQAWHKHRCPHGTQAWSRRACRHRQHSSTSARSSGDADGAVVANSSGAISDDHGAALAGTSREGATRVSAAKRSSSCGSGSCGLGSSSGPAGRTFGRLGGSPR